MTNYPVSLSIAWLGLALAACGGGGRESATDATAFSSNTLTDATATDPATTPPTSGSTETSAGPSADTGMTTIDVPATTSTTDPVDSSTGPVDPSTTTGSGPGTTTIDPPPPDCSTVLKATVRDFSVSHPDFEDYLGSLTGIVQADLGGDKKPVYAAPGPTAVTAGPEYFVQWYNDTADINQPFAIDIPLTEIMPGQYTYDNSNFFPIDGQGFGDEGNIHNFHFTTEIHTEFAYQGGEVFTFIGDDDLWLFINNKLAIDLGGVHGAQSQSIDLDASAAALGIQIGEQYPMDIFHAERHTTQSNFRVDTSIQCFIIPG